MPQQQQRRHSCFPEPSESLSLISILSLSLISIKFKFKLKANVGEIVSAAAFLLSRAVEIRPEWKHLEWDTKAGESISHRQTCQQLNFYISDNIWENISHLSTFTLEPLLAGSSDTFTLGMARTGMFSSQIGRWDQYWKKKHVFMTVFFSEMKAVRAAKVSFYMSTPLWGLEQKGMLATDSAGVCGGMMWGGDVGSRKHPCRRRVMPR